MRKAEFINYQGSKLGIIDFICKGISEITENDGNVLDLFSGSGVVSSNLLDKYNVVSNDSELYASTICRVFSINTNLTDEQFKTIFDSFDFYKKHLIDIENLSKSLKDEKKFLQTNNLLELVKIYVNHKTIWNSPTELTNEILKLSGRYNLFTRYYAGTYFGIEQSIEIDSLVYAIKSNEYPIKDLFYACLFFAMKECSFSRDGHMAQPLNILKNGNRAIVTRSKSIINLFKSKLEQCINELNGSLNKTHEVYNYKCEDIINNDNIMNRIDVVYADPPYTDMQYSRYYHLLNVVINYDFPQPTITKNGFTKGLYTEGRFQSELSQRGKAKRQLLNIITKVKHFNKSLALSYAYPKNQLNQKTDRYTISIEELIDMCKDVYGSDNIKVNQINYSHANHKNNSSKGVIEYLILCSSKVNKFKPVNIGNLKISLSEIKPTNRNPIYNTHLYWSQKAFNVTDLLIKNLTNEGDIIFDPFLGSGVTILEAIKKENSRQAIGCDVNEMPLFISKTLTKYALNTSAISELKKFKEESVFLKKFYQVKCRKCERDALIDKVVFDKPIRNENKVLISSVSIKCYCGEKIYDNFDFVKNQMYKKYNYIFVDSEYKLLKNSKIAVLENDKIANIFTNRNLKVLDEILLLSKKYSSDLQNIIKYIINSLLHQAKITDKHSNSQWLLWIPKKDCVEKNICFLMDKKIDAFIKATKEIRRNYFENSLVSDFNKLGKNKAMLLNIGSQFITDKHIPNDSIDLIITDPPYLEQVLYSEYMQLYKPIVGLSFNLDDEIIISSAKERRKNKDTYYKDLENVFIMCGNKLKRNKFMCLYFHDSDLSVWYKLISSIYYSGFKFIGQTHIKRNITLKNIISPKKSLNGDSILFFCNIKLKDIYNDGKETIEEIELNLIDEAKHMLKIHGSLSTPELYDNGLMELLITNGWLNKISKKYKSLVELFEKVFVWDSNTAKWKL